MTLEVAKSILETIIRSDSARLDLQSEVQQTVFLELVRDATPLVAARLVGALPKGHALLSETVMSKFTPGDIATLPIKSVQSVFVRLSTAQQNACLTHLYQIDPDRYQACIGVDRLQWIRVGNRFIERVKATELLETMHNRLVNEMTSPAVSVLDIQSVCDRMQDEFEWMDVVSVLTQSLQSVLDRTPEMKSADELNIFLKAHFLLTAFPFAFPESIVSSILMPTIRGLGQMPTTEWVLKVLNQFDESSIQRIVAQADIDQRHGDANRRNPALKILKAIRELVDMPEFKTVRFALGLESE